MIISRGRKYIFVHIPKTGGTSMALALEDRAMKDDLMLGDTPKARKRRRRLKDAPARGRLWKHSTLADIDGVVSVAEIAEMFCFTLVRNPWDRSVSYYHWLREQEFEHPAVGLAKALEFDAFIQHPRTLAGFQANPASAYMRDASGVERAGAYVRLEHLETDLAPVEQHLGFKLSLPHENKSHRRTDFRKYYSESAKKSVAEACAEDIERFGYRFDG